MGVLERTGVFVHIKSLVCAFVCASTCAFASAARARAKSSISVIACAFASVVASAFATALASPARLLAHPFVCALAWAPVGAPSALARACTFQLMWLF